MGRHCSRRRRLWQGILLNGERMKKINCASIKKTIYYLRRNGIRKTCAAVRERLDGKRAESYEWVPPTADKLLMQSRYADEQGYTITFSIVVPAYRTPGNCLRELVGALLAQSYGKWELILADASDDSSVRDVVAEYSDARIRYIRLGQNAGIAENTNQALQYVTGAYVGLLDHDDVLTADALFEMAKRIEEGRRIGREPWMLYSDEDKCNGDMTEYFEPNRKEDFNLDLLLSNNYICHFLVMRAELIQKLRLRKEFDGAQDYDLVLRAAAELKEREDMIVHIPRVLYHWRCHSGSTAENPASKMYAYHAGGQAVQAFADAMGWEAQTVATEHLGFYRLRYQGSPLRVRDDLGAVGGRLVSHGRICGGRMTEEGKVVYENLPVNYSGYLHRAVLSQDAQALDIRNMEVRTSLRELFREVTGLEYAVIPGTEKFDPATIPPQENPVELSLRLSRALREKGYRLLYLPEY